MCPLSGYRADDFLYFSYNSTDPMKRSKPDTGNYIFMIYCERSVSSVGTKSPKLGTEVKSIMRLTNMLLVLVFV